MTACAKGTGPSKYASDHMLGYVDNMAELDILRRMLLTERRKRMERYVTDDGRLVKIAEPGCPDGTRFISCTLDEAEEIAGQIDELVSRGRRLEVHVHESEACPTCGGNRCAVCARPYDVGVMDGECVCEKGRI